VKVVWDVRSRVGGESGTVLSSTLRFVAADEPSRSRLLASWGTLGAGSRGLLRRALRAVKASAEVNERAPLHSRPAPARVPVLAAA
jgi:hypothetical protein